MHKYKSLNLITSVDIDVPDCILYLAIGKRVTEVEKYLTEKKISRESIVYIKDCLKDIDDKFAGMFIRTPKGLRFLYLVDYKGTWDDLVTLSHELYHFVDFEAQYRMFEAEPEFKAYLHGGLFKKLRRMLGKELDKQKIVPKKSKAKPRLKK